MSPLVTLLTPTVLVLISYRARFLTLDGCIAAWFVGAAVVDAGLSATLQLLAFFFLGSVTTKYKQARKDAMMPYQEAPTPRAAAPAAAVGGDDSRPDNTKKKGRTSQQVLATGLVPALFCLLRHVPISALPASSALDPLKYALSHSALLYSTFMSVNLADTLASELGMLSPHPPMLVTQWRGTVAAGVDGGVSLLGTLASLLGGLLIGLCAGDLHSIAVLTLCGVNGSLVDSLLGVLLQSQPSPDKTTARSTSNSAGHVTHQPRRLSVQQWASSNALVNLLSCSVTCLLHLLLHYANERYGVSALPSLALLDALVLLYTCQPWVGVAVLDNVALLMVAVWSVACCSNTMQLLLWWGAVLYFWALKPYLAGQAPAPATSRAKGKDL